MTAGTGRDAHTLRPHVDSHDDEHGRARWWPCVIDGPDHIVQFHSHRPFGSLWAGSAWDDGPFGLRPHLYRSRRHAWHVACRHARRQARKAAREERWTAREEQWRR